MKRAHIALLTVLAFGSSVAVVTTSWAAPKQRRFRVSTGIGVRGAPNYPNDAVETGFYTDLKLTWRHRNWFAHDLSLSWGFNKAKRAEDTGISTLLVSSSVKFGYAWRVIELWYFLGLGTGAVLNEECNGTVMGPTTGFEIAFNIGNHFTITLYEEVHALVALSGMGDGDRTATFVNIVGAVAWRF